MQGASMAVLEFRKPRRTTPASARSRLSATVKLSRYCRCRVEAVIRQRLWIWSAQPGADMGGVVGFGMCNQKEGWKSQQQPRRKGDLAEQGLSGRVHVH